MIARQVTVALSAAVISIGGCKPRDSSVLQSTESSTESTRSGCTADPLTGGDATGAEIYDLTSRCVFDDAVHELHIRIFGETFQKVLDDGCADRDNGFGHVLEFVLDGKSIQNIGIKVRGNTSKCSPKRQFKFKFDVDDAYSVVGGKLTTQKFPENAGRTFEGLAGLSIRASANDPSMIRERLSSQMFSAAEALQPTAARGGMVYRASFTKFFVSFNRPTDQGPEGAFTKLIDGFYYDDKGFYSLTENIDKIFLRTRFEMGSIKLKGYYLYQADLARAFFDRAKYTRTGWPADYANGKKADDEAGKAAADAKLLSLIDLLATAPNEATLAQSIDLDNVINYVASAILAGHWDSLLTNRNNDFLFFNGDKQKWQLIGWDLDNTQGALIDQYHRLTSNDIFAPAKVNESKLFEVMFNPKQVRTRAMLKGRLAALINGPLAPGKFDAAVDELEVQVRAHALSWEGYNHQNFQDIKNFSQARRAAIQPQL